MDQFWTIGSNSPAGKSSPSPDILSANGKWSSDRGQSGLCVLVVDDCAVSLALTLELLADRGYEVYGAASAEEAFGLLNKRPVWAVLADMLLPDKSGAWLLEQVFQNHWAQRVIAITGGGKINGIAAEDAARTAGAHMVLPKPLPTRLLLDALNPDLDKTNQIRQ